MGSLRDEEFNLTAHDTESATEPIIGPDGELLNAAEVDNPKKKKRNPVIRNVLRSFRLTFWLVFALFSAVGIAAVIVIQRGPGLSSLLKGQNSASNVDPGNFCNMAALGVTTNHQMFVALQRSGKSGSEIYRANLDGSNVKYVTTIDSMPDFITFSGDGAYVFYSRWENADKIFVMDLDTLTERYLSNGLYPAISADNKLVLYSANRNKLWHLYRIDFDGSNESAIDIGDLIPDNVSWSQDTKRVVFTATSRIGATTTQVYVMDADGSNIQQLTGGQDLARWPGWSPDGKHLAFVASKLTIMNADGTNQLLADVNASRLFWLDNDHILFSGYVQGQNKQGVFILDSATLQAQAAFSCNQIPARQ